LTKVVIAGADLDYLVLGVRITTEETQ